MPSFLRTLFRRGSKKRRHKAKNENNITNDGNNSQTAQTGGNTNTTIASSSFSVPPDAECNNDTSNVSNQSSSNLHNRMSSVTFDEYSPYAECRQRNSSSSMQQQQYQSTTPLANESVNKTTKPIIDNNTNYDIATNDAAYEERIEELGQLMLEQGRCLDELTTRSHRLSTENGMLRERLSTSIENMLVIPRSNDSRDANENNGPTSEATTTAASQNNRSPLMNIINLTKKNSNESSSSSSAISKNGERSITNSMTTTTMAMAPKDSKLLQKYKDENDLLLQQSDLLAKELHFANEQLTERDISVETLGRELSACLEKARMCK